MGYKGGTFARGIVPSKVLASRATEAPQQFLLSHGLQIAHAKFYSLAVDMGNAVSMAHFARRGQRHNCLHENLLSNAFA
jgi:hypothetical protein